MPNQDTLPGTKEYFIARCRGCDTALGAWGVNSPMVRRVVKEMLADGYRVERERHDVVHLRSHGAGCPIAASEVLASAQPPLDSEMQRLGFVSKRKRGSRHA